MSRLLTNGLFGMLFPDGFTGSTPHTAIAVYMLSMLLPALCGYLLGSVNSAVIISRVFYHDDVRKHGSGNGGTTNVMRTYGKKAAIGTFAGDIAKTALSVLIGALLMGEDGAYMAGLGAVVGHIFPVFFHFHGGKGVACAAALVLCTEPLLFVILIAIFVVIVACSKFISLGSVMCVIIYPLFLSRIYVLTHHTEGIPIIPLLVSFLVMILILFMHRSNIRRLMKGEENKFSFKKSVKTPGKDDTPDSQNPQDPKDGGNA